MPMPSHHPFDAHLVDYASGALAEPLALMVATHLGWCPGCRRDVSALEVVGGLLLEELAPESLAADTASRLLARLGQSPEPAARLAPRCAAGRLPAPLVDYLDSHLDALPWRRLGSSAWQADIIPRRADGLTTRLLRIRAGAATVAHTHTGNEYTLVLEGAFKDEAGHYETGDFTALDAGVQHLPIADTGRDCICLVVAEGPLRFTGPIARLANPVMRLLD